MLKKQKKIIINYIYNVEIFKHLKPQENNNTTKKERIIFFILFALIFLKLLNKMSFLFYKKLKRKIVTIYFINSILNYY